jgi:hypothetical protein
MLSVLLERSREVAFARLSNSVSRADSVYFGAYVQGPYSVASQQINRGDTVNFSNAIATPPSDMKWNEGSSTASFNMGGFWTASTFGGTSPLGDCYRTIGLAAENSSVTYVRGVLETLSALNDGWNGEGSFAPSESVRSDIEAVLALAPTPPKPPLLEVDDDGTVALLWDRLHTTFALTFLGDGTVVGTVSPRSSSGPWSANVRSPALASLLSSAWRNVIV